MLKEYYPSNYTQGNQTIYFCASQIVLCNNGCSNGKCEQCGLCGDLDGNGQVDTTDVNQLIDYLYSGGSLTCESKADVDSSGAVDTLDLTVLIDYVYNNGPALNCSA